MDGELLLLLVVLPGFFATRVRAAFRRGGARSWQETAVAALGYDLPIFGGLLLISRFLPKTYSLELLLASSAAQSAEYYAIWMGLALGVALLVGTISGLVSQTGGVHAILYVLRLSHQTGKADIWDDVFTDQAAQEKWAKVYMKDGTVYVGWPKYFGTSDRPGLFLSRTQCHNVSCHRPAKAETENAIERNISGPGVFLPTTDEVAAIELFDGEP